ncbi:MAG TPA: hypothetical protein DCM07_00405 [Planctomycetaceae bacterium]|nr:hypothetical protein [Gimesia sp.]HAH43318.1 hypothetical protein [Planctomycetaceae bacterium]HBL48219.1 hypothetical protein [Planctomycetaceae bacterium]|tara:strand:+ start:278 stop:481 length:204 start_codon:yes stop_codon:yes gene_type:complete
MRSQAQPVTGLSFIFADMSEITVKIIRFSTAQFLFPKFDFPDILPHLQHESGVFPARMAETHHSPKA